MPEEGEQMHVEQQSTAGKWILLVLAILFVAASVFGYVTTQMHVQKLTADLSASQAQIGELQKRVQSSEAQEETIAQRLGMTKKELMQRAAALQAQQKADESRLAKEEKE
jgi:CRISPR/Cas system CMR subunit Cmr4 (Cas7 group RAMP superfamily)